MRKLLIITFLLVITNSVFAWQDPESQEKNTKTSPDSKSQAYLAKDFYRTWQLFIKDKDPENPRQITFFLSPLYVLENNLKSGVMDFYWSPESDKILISALTLQDQFPTKSVGRARRADESYNNYTLLVVNLSDLNTIYIAGSPLQVSEMVVDISNVKWLDSENIQFDYRLWDDSGKSQGTKIKSLSEGKQIQFSGDKTDWEIFFEAQLITYQILDMIKNKPTFSQGIRGIERELAIKVLKRPNLKLVDIWYWEDNNCYIAQVDISSKEEFETYNFDIRNNKIISCNFLEGSP